EISFKSNVIALAGAAKFTKSNEVQATNDERVLVKAASSQRRAGADGLVSSGGRKGPAGEIQVCERQQREHLGSVLGDATIAHLAIAELALHDTKHVLDFRAHFAQPMIAGTLAGRQPAAGFGL